jgi:EH_Signature domain
MRASDELRGAGSTLNGGVLPALTHLERAVRRVQEQWPGVKPEPQEKERNALAREMLGRVERSDWSGVSTWRVTAGAVAVFDEARRDSDVLAPLRAFYFREIESTDQPTILNGLFWVYVESFDPIATHTNRFAAALSKREKDFDTRISYLLGNVDGLLRPASAARAIANRMVSSSKPYIDLKKLGFPAPHAPGVLYFAHLAFLEAIKGRLDRTEEQRRLLQWLRPDSIQVLQQGAAQAIAALLFPWQNASPPASDQSHLTESIVGAYGDPRLIQGGVWAGFPQNLKNVLLRWLTREDMRFFCDVISETQYHHHWPPRRNFWLRLFEERRIDEAWVAFGSTARDHAKQRYKGTGALNVDKRFAKQLDRGGSTSLLIMRIGRKIVVDGCHSYKTHIFRADDPNAPKLYQTSYYCDDIMRRSNLSKAHHPIPNWQLWVEQHV